MTETTIPKSTFKYSEDRELVDLPGYVWPLLKLRPTQVSVGMESAVYRAVFITKLLLKKGPDELIKYLRSKPIYCVLGPSFHSKKRDRSSTTELSNLDHNDEVEAPMDLLPPNLHMLPSMDTCTSIYQLFSCLNIPANAMQESSKGRMDDLDPSSDTETTTTTTIHNQDVTTTSHPTGISSRQGEGSLRQNSDPNLYSLDKHHTMLALLICAAGPYKHLFHPVFTSIRSIFSFVPPSILHQVTTTTENNDVEVTIHNRSGERDTSLTQPMAESTEDIDLCCESLNGLIFRTYFEPKHGFLATTGSLSPLSTFHSDDASLTEYPVPSGLQLLPAQGDCYGNSARLSFAQPLVFVQVIDDMSDQSFDSFLEELRSRNYVCSRDTDHLIPKNMSSSVALLPDDPFKSISWAARHRATSGVGDGTRDSTGTSSGPGYIAPSWLFFHSNTDWAMYIRDVWLELYTALDMERKRQSPVSDKESLLSEMNTKLRGLEFSPDVVNAACAVCYLPNAETLPGFIRKNGEPDEVVTDTRSRSRSRGRRDDRTPMNQPLLPPVLELEWDGSEQDSLSLSRSQPPSSLTPHVIPPSGSFHRLKLKGEKEKRRLSPFDGDSDRVSSSLNSIESLGLHTHTLSNPNANGRSKPSVSTEMLVTGTDSSNTIVALKSLSSPTPTPNPSLRGASSFQHLARAGMEDAPPTDDLSGNLHGDTMVTSPNSSLFSSPPSSLRSIPVDSGYLSNSMRTVHPTSHPSYQQLGSVGAHVCMSLYDLRPTQPVVGFSAADLKRKNLEKAFEEGGANSSERLEALVALLRSPENNVPCVTGKSSCVQYSMNEKESISVDQISGSMESTGNISLGSSDFSYFITDHHHLVYALSKARFPGLSSEEEKIARRVFVAVDIDLRDLSPAEFWIEMCKQSKCYLKRFGMPILPTDLPLDIPSLEDDPLRSLSWMARKLKKINPEKKKQKQDQAQVQGQSQIQNYKHNHNDNGNGNDSNITNMINIHVSKTTSLSILINDVDVGATGTASVSMSDYNYNSKPNSQCNDLSVEVLNLFYPGYLKVPVDFMEFIWGDYLRSHPLLLEVQPLYLREKIEKQSAIAWYASLICRLPGASGNKGHIKPPSMMLPFATLTLASHMEGQTTNSNSNGTQRLDYFADMWHIILLADRVSMNPLPDALLATSTAHFLRRWPLISASQHEAWKLEFLGKHQGWEKPVIAKVFGMALSSYSQQNAFVYTVFLYKAIKMMRQALLHLCHDQRGNETSNRGVKP